MPTSTPCGGNRPSRTRALSGFSKPSAAISMIADVAQELDAGHPRGQTFALGQEVDGAVADADDRARAFGEPAGRKGAERRRELAAGDPWPAPR